jgi:Ca2+/Na+ antiporter
LLATGTVVVGFTSHLVEATPLPETAIGLIISGAILSLCIPPGIVLWRQTTTLADALTRYMFQRTSVSPRLWRADELRGLIRYTLAISLVIALTVWTMPFVFRLLALGGISGVVPVLILALALLVTVGAAFRIHAVLEHTFGRTLLGPPLEAEHEPTPGSDRPETPH